MIVVRVPATSANLGPGFDAVGLALRLHNTLELWAADAPLIDVEGEGAETLPRNTSHLAHRAAIAVVDRAGRTRGTAAPRAFGIRQRNRIPLARGLGSSAAAIVGGAVAANALLGGPLDRQALLDLAAEIEGHPDNVAAALLGGLAVCAGTPSGVRAMRLTPPPISVVAAVPDFAVSTSEARRLLPSRVPFDDAVFNVTRTALLVAALSGGRPDLLGDATEDRLHQPYRAALVPGLTEVFAAARRAGANGVALSGSGPTVLAFGGPPGVGPAMVEAFGAAGVRCRTLDLQVDTEGAVVESRT
ncbi:MAG TPA: homoserine kinase [bacterium]|nr:homoserine kinase [bacterium]